jgi:hypothetical protein
MHAPIARIYPPISSRIAVAVKDMAGVREVRQVVVHHADRTVYVHYSGTVHAREVKALMMHDPNTGQSLRPPGYDLFVQCEGE